MSEETLSLISQVDVLTRKLEQAELDSRRTEAFAASAFVLSVMLVRELMAIDQLSKDQGVLLVKTAIRYLRRIYHLGEGQQDGDTIDTDKFLVALGNIEHEQDAETLLRDLLASLTKRAG